MDEMNQKQFKAFLMLLRKDLIRIEDIENLDEIKDELKQVIVTIQMMIEDWTIKGNRKGGELKPPQLYLKNIIILLLWQ